MKKIFALLTVISIIALVFCSCGKKEVIVDNNGDVSSTSSQNSDIETVNSSETDSGNSLPQAVIRAMVQQAVKTNLPATVKPAILRVPMWAILTAK